MQDELDRRFPSSNVKILAINEIGHESANATAAALNDLPLLQDVDANNDNQSDVWESWDASWRDVRVVDSNGELQSPVMNLIADNLQRTADYQRLLNSIVDTAKSTRVVGSAWQNPTEPLDINNDGDIAPNDVLTVINRINTVGAGQLSAPSGAVSDFYDASGDNHLTPIDALRVIQQLNRFNVGNGEPDQAESDTSDADQAAQRAARAAAVDALYASHNQQDDDDESLA